MCISINKQPVNFLSQLLLSIISTMIAVSSLSAAEQLRGTVSLDGSSTVFPISEAVAEEFNAVQPRVRVTVGVSAPGEALKNSSLEKLILTTLPGLLARANGKKRKQRVWI